MGIGVFPVMVVIEVAHFPVGLFDDVKAGHAPAVSLYVFPEGGGWLFVEVVLCPEGVLGGVVIHPLKDTRGYGVVRVVFVLDGR